MKATLLGLFFIALVVFTVPVFSKEDNVLTEESMVLFVESVISEETELSLVPTTSQLGENETNFITQTYYVQVSEGLDFDVLVENLHMGGTNANYSELRNLFNFRIDVNEVSPEDTNIFDFYDNTITYEVFVLISMNEPESLEQYQMIAGKQLSVDYAFIAI